MHVTKHAETEE